MPHAPIFHSLFIRECPRRQDEGVHLGLALKPQAPSPERWFARHVVGHKLHHI